MTVRQAISDGRSVTGLRILDGKRDRFRIVTVDAGGMPVRRPEALDLVVGDGKAGRAVDRDLIVVEQHDEPAELEMAGERDRLVADALHQAAVARHAIGEVVDDVVAVAAIEQPLGERHADGIAETLAERPGGRLDAGRMAIFRVARRARAELAEVLELLELHLGIAGEIEQRVEQHRAVAGRQHEAVAVGPIGVRGVELQEAREQHGGDIGHAHGHAGMAGIGLLHGVHGQRPDGIGHVLMGRFRQRLILHQGFGHRSFPQIREDSNTRGCPSQP